MRRRHRVRPGGRARRRDARRRGRRGPGQDPQRLLRRSGDRPVQQRCCHQDGLDWADFAAIPEAYATAWTALHGNLKLSAGETVLVRGATSSVGQAAVNLAVDLGAAVVATTRTESRRALLRELGAEHVLIDNGQVAEHLRRIYPSGVGCVLDLVGNAVLRDSLQSVRPKGRVCQIGFLGGLDPVIDFSPLADLPSGVQLSTFASAFVLGDDQFPLADVPFQELVTKAERGVLKARPARVFPFEQIVAAHRLLEANEAVGKVVVTVDSQMAG